VGEPALVGGRIHTAPGVPPIADGIVLVRGSVIAAVGTRQAVPVPGGAEVLDCTGLVLSAGFWNSHVHLGNWRLLLGGRLPGAASELREMLGRYGFVHVLDTGSPLVSTTRLRERISTGALVGPEIRTTGLGFVAPGGSPFYLKPFHLPALATADDARAAVREQIDAGADGIKLFAGGLATPESVVVMDVAIVRAVTEAAHARGAFVVAHPSNGAGARAALEGGVDILAHTFWNEREGPWDRSLTEGMKKSGMALVPTLKLWKYELERAGLPAEAVARRIREAQEQVRSFAAQGGQILFGTDVGYMRDFDPTDEYVFLSEAGLEFAQILAALTTAPAERFGASSRSGRIAPGLDADLVVLEGSPEQDVRALARVRYALRRGQIVFRSE
jgi:imidazolonepropionase-like amidohydrolase